MYIESFGWASARALQAGLTKLEMPSKEDMKAFEPTQAAAIGRGYAKGLLARISGRS